MKHFYPTPCHENSKVALRDFLSCLGFIDSIMVLNRPPISTIGFSVQIDPL